MPALRLFPKATDVMAVPAMAGPALASATVT